jgi:UDP-glucuronate 4-epimerase
MAYFSFTDAIMKGKPIQIYNEGKMKRDFTYIDDIVAGTVAAIDLGAPCEIFNLGNHKPEELLYLVELLEKKLGKTAIKKMLPMQPGEVEVTYADISKSKKQLGFSPTTALEAGIEKFLSWYQDLSLPNF